MKITADNRYELIDKFISGLMDTHENEQFSSYLKNDEELSAEVNLVRELHEFQEFSVKEDNLRKTLHTLQKPKSSSKSYLKYILIALIAGSALLYFFNSLNTASQSDMQIQMAMVEPLHLIVKGETEYKNVREMQDLFNGGNYKAAFPYIENYLAQHPRDLDVLLAKGVALTSMDKYSEAQAVFSQIESYNPRVKKYKLYSAVNLIEQGKKQDAIVILEDIITNKSFNYQEAQSLIEKLK